MNNFSFKTCSSALSRNFATKGQKIELFTKSWNFMLWLTADNFFGRENTPEVEVERGQISRALSIKRRDHSSPEEHEPAKIPLDPSLPN